MIALGIMVVYAAGVCTDGVLYGGQGHLQSLIVVLFFVFLGEAWVLLGSSMEPLVVENQLHQMWKRTFYDNRRRLSWFESYYGCCGFKNATDMPSSERCILSRVSIQEAHVHGCLKLMSQDIFHHNKLALQWCLAAVVVQAAVIIFGYGIYKRVYEIDTTWIVENTDDVEAAREGDVGIPWNAPTAESQMAEPAQQDTGASAGAALVKDDQGMIPEPEAAAQSQPESQSEPQQKQEQAKVIYFEEQSGIQPGSEQQPEPESTPVFVSKAPELNEAAKAASNSGSSSAAKSTSTKNQQQQQQQRSRKGKGKR
ncbi:hypothetical protein FB645_001558 [Coemansia sp. IMI 203386]|nr:hypothetical protein FB645_001558 [Coemansia sp. IMI 203386]